jgi:DNA-binding transcriptional ArsR family regulator
MHSLSKLFGSPARLKTIRLFVFNKSALLSSVEIVQRTKLSKEIVRRELSDLLAAGLIRKKGEGAKVRYQTNPTFEHLRELDGFVRGTTSVSPRGMADTLRKSGVLRLVALSGLFTDVLESQVDLLVVGDRLDERILAAAIRSLEAELGREIRYAALATEDFRYRLGVYDRLVRDVFDYPHRLLIDKIGL